MAQQQVVPPPAETRYWLRVIYTGRQDVTDAYVNSILPLPTEITYIPTPNVQPEEIKRVRVNYPNIRYIRGFVATGPVNGPLVANPNPDPNEIEITADDERRQNGIPTNGTTQVMQISSFRKTALALLKTYDSHSMLSYHNFGGCFAMEMHLYSEIVNVYLSLFPGNDMNSFFVPIQVASFPNNIFPHDLVNLEAIEVAVIAKYRIAALRMIDEIVDSDQIKPYYKDAIILAVESNGIAKVSLLIAFFSIAFSLFQLGR
mmetsp:Transcript_23528/g.21401  ORF Transcript_23528/g.21401 Transcript_23528/m.21401 type:complete len:259 (+) Transcript_23528:55-831(+)